MMMMAMVSFSLTILAVARRVEHCLEERVVGWNAAGRSGWPWSVGMQLAPETARFGWISSLRRQLEMGLALVLKLKCRWLDEAKRGEQVTASRAQMQLGLL